MIASAIAGTILVVEDCEVLCELFDVLLSRMGYRVLTATSAAEALQVARTFPKIDLLIATTDAPDMGGDELARRVVRLHPSAHVIFLSSFSVPMDAAQPHESLAKPFTVAELRASVRRALLLRPAPPDATLVA